MRATAEEAGGRGGRGWRGGPGKVPDANWALPLATEQARPAALGLSFPICEMGAGEPALPRACRLGAATSCNTEKAVSSFNKRSRPSTWKRADADRAGEAWRMSVLPSATSDPARPANHQETAPSSVCREDAARSGVPPSDPDTDGGLMLRAPWQGWAQRMQPAWGGGKEERGREGPASRSRTWRGPRPRARSFLVPWVSFPAA